LFLLLAVHSSTFGDLPLLRDWDLNQLQWEFQYLIPKSHQSALLFIFSLLLLFSPFLHAEKSAVSYRKQIPQSFSYSFEHKSKILLEVNSTESGHLVM